MSLEQNKKLLVLDLDETLIYSSESKLNREHDFIVSDYFVYKRPFLDDFLEYCRQNFCISIWTSADIFYAKRIIDLIFTEDDHFEFIWTRDKCTNYFDSELLEYIPVKNFKKIKNKGYDLNHVICLDDSPEKHIKNYGNLVRVKPYFGEDEDKELLFLIEYLKKLKIESNIRMVEKRGWRRFITNHA